MTNEKKLAILLNDLNESLERGTEFESAVQFALHEVKTTERKENVLTEIFNNDPLNILSLEN